jgi:hypothetical protein
MYRSNLITKKVCNEWLGNENEKNFFAPGNRCRSGQNDDEDEIINLNQENDCLNNDLNEVSENENEL